MYELFASFGIFALRLLFLKESHNAAYNGGVVFLMYNPNIHWEYS